MSFYALGNISLLNALRLTSPNVSQVCIADDIIGAGKLINHRKWWNTIVTQGSKFGYYINQSKSWIISKNEKDLNEAKRIFEGTDRKFTTEGKRYLRAAIGSQDSKTAYANDNVKSWCEEIIKLTEYAKSQTQAAYAAFRHAEIHKLKYFMRTIPGMKEYLRPLDEMICNTFIPVLLQSIITDQDRKFYSIPVRFGGSESLYY